MSRRRYHLPPPAIDRHVFGQVLELLPVPGTPEPQPDKMIELKPVGPPPLVLEFKAEDEQVTPPGPEKSPPAPAEPTT